MRTFNFSVEMDLGVWGPTEVEISFDDEQVDAHTYIFAVRDLKICGISVAFLLDKDSHIHDVCRYRVEQYLAGEI